jgi:hypothetical protein
MEIDHRCRDNRPQQRQHLRNQMANILHALGSTFTNETYPLTPSVNTPLEPSSALFLQSRTRGLYRGSRPSFSITTPPSRLPQRDIALVHFQYTSLSTTQTFHVSLYSLYFFFFILTNVPSIQCVYQPPSTYHTHGLSVV